MVIRLPCLETFNFRGGYLFSHFFGERQHLFLSMGLQYINIVLIDFFINFVLGFFNSNTIIISTNFSTNFLFFKAVQSCAACYIFTARFYIISYYKKCLEYDYI